ncbi:MAG: ferrous iron transport protein B [Bacteroidales bacterium]|nr:ferrous iron transport protein B [Bacteroidales bacterium]
MNLSDLITGQEAFITGISGNGGIKDRLNELGFIRGQKVKAIKAAPLRDPVEYEIMGYKVTIRKADAAAINIARTDKTVKEAHNGFRHQHGHGQKNRMRRTRPRHGRSRTINVALIGNPNCGKTTIYNYATRSRERVANYAGVTVAAREARLDIDNYRINLIDLPGTYSLKAYSPEEMFVTDYLLYNKPDIVLNVIDAGNLERNLFLTTQLIDSGIITVAALNMYDELEKSKGRLDHEVLGKMLGIPIVPTVGSRGVGLKDLFSTIIKVYEGRDERVRQARLNYGQEIDDSIEKVISMTAESGELENNISRLTAIRFLEDDTSALPQIPATIMKRVKDFAATRRKNVESLIKNNISNQIVNMRYAFIEGALAETYIPARKQTISISQSIDRVLTHKIWGLPVFFGIIWFIFFSTFRLGEIPMGWIESLFRWLGGAISASPGQGIAGRLLSDGVIGGVGGVMVFLPNIMILFAFISLLEDSGYMARTAFLMDKVMHRAGLHGKSFIPLLMGFGCNVPAIMATRTIDSKRDRLITMFITPFMSCSARLPVYVLFISAFFPHYESLMLFAIYAIGILAALLTALVLNKTIFRKTESPFVMELPPYRVPTMRSVFKHTWFKTSHFLKKMGTIILFASIVIWALGYFPRDREIINKYDNLISGNPPDAERYESMKASAMLEQSYISRIGKAVQPVFEPLGFDWRMSVSILTGIMAKEVVVSSMGILYQAGASSGEDGITLVEKLRNSRIASETPLISYFGFLVFVLLYFPCMGALLAIKKETAKYKWTIFSAVYPLVFAWVTVFIINQVHSLLLNFS